LRGGAHLAIGAGSTVLVLYGLKALGAPLDSLTIAFGAGAAGLGALAPDVDHPRATASKSLPDELFHQAMDLALPFVLLGGAFAVFAGQSVGVSILDSFSPLLKMAGVMLALAIAFVIASKLAHRYSTHRGATHSLFMAAGATLLVMVACLIAAVPVWYGMAFGWGWLTHLAADMTTKTGLPSLMWHPFRQTQIPAGVPVTVSAPVHEAASVATALPTGLETSPTIPVCPTCGVPMMLRTAKRGSHQGNQFYGCANYPSCRQTRQL